MACSTPILPPLVQISGAEATTAEISGPKEVVTLLVICLAPLTSS